MSSVKPLYPTLVERELSNDERSAVDHIRKMAKEVGDYIHNLKYGDPCQNADGLVDMRWLAIAQTEMQKAFMCLERSISKPDRF